MSASETATDNPSPGSAPVLGGVIPYLQVAGASEAAELYSRAFGAIEVARHPVDKSGRTMHIHLHINGSSVMLGDPYPEHGVPLEKPQAYTLVLQVDDIDSWFTRAVAADLAVLMPVQPMFWGARYGSLKDRFGVTWAMNQPM